MTIVAFEKQVAFKSLFSKRLFDSTVVLNLRKNIYIYKWKEKVQSPSKDFIALFSSRRRACLVLKHNRVSEVFTGFKVHDFEYLLRSKKLHFEMEM